MERIPDILHYEIFNIGDSLVTVSTLAVSLFIVALAFVFARVAERASIGFLAGRGVRDADSASATGRLLYYAVLALGFAIAIDTLGVDLTALFAAGAFFAIALGFAMQNITQNFVSGLILLVERTIKPNDIIEVEGRMVKITKLGMRATVVRTWDSEDYIIPNSILVSQTVKNFTLRDRLYRIRALVGVTYGSDMAEVRRVLEKVTYDLAWRETSMNPVILMREFGSSSVDFDVSVWVNDPFQRSLGLSNLNEAIWAALKEADITIAFPQLDVHFDEPRSISVE